VVIPVRPSVRVWEATAAHRAISKVANPPIIQIRE